MVKEKINNKELKKKLNKEKSNNIKSKKNKGRSKLYYGFIFLWFITLLFLYIYYFVTNYSIFKKIIVELSKLIFEVFKVLVFIYLFMVIFDYYFKEEKLKKLVSKLKGLKGLIITAFLGIISSGPLYVWFPFLKNLTQKGVDYKYVVIFLYNRAIKLPLIPVMFLVYDLKFILILFTLMIISSFIIGFLTEELLRLFGEKEI